MSGLVLDTPVGVSLRASRLPGSSLKELFLLARGRQAIDLAVGTPAFPVTPDALVEAAVGALRAGRNQYEDPAGEAGLRRRIAASLGTPADPDTEITVTAGGTEALCVALLATIDPGDEVVLLEPFYENFRNAVTIAGGVPRIVPLRPPDWAWDPAELAAAFGPRTRAIILNSPSNPTGRLLRRDELAEVAELCARWGATVISDEVYSGLVYGDRPHVSVADLPQLRGRAIVVGSLSKNLAVSGWRLGFLRADPAITSVLRRVHEVTTNGTGAPLQFAVGHTDVLDGDGWRPAPDMAVRRNIAQQMLKAMGLWARPAEGGCFLLADISPITDDDCHSYARDLLDTRSVLVVPGTAFFANAYRGRSYIRVAFNRSVETLTSAARQLLS
jgi:N-succinyldiaminopimelate aminotransferase